MEGISSVVVIGAKTLRSDARRHRPTCTSIKARSKYTFLRYKHASCVQASSTAILASEATGALAFAVCVSNPSKKLQFIKCDQWCTEVCTLFQVYSLYLQAFCLSDISPEQAHQRPALQGALDKSGDALRSLCNRSLASLTRPVNCRIMISMGDVERSERSSITTIPPLSFTCTQKKDMGQDLQHTQYQDAIPIPD